MLKLLLILVAFSSGVLCHVAQDRTDTVTRSLDPIDLMNNNENVHSASADEQIHKVTKRCVKGDMMRSDYIHTPGIGYHKMHNRKMTWNKARKSCISEGGQLVIIKSAGEAAILMNWMAKQNATWIWIGVHRYFGDDEWVSLTGEPLEKSGYDIWAQSQPDNYYGEEYCGTLAYSGGMADVSCDKVQYQYVCKIDTC